VNLYDQNIRRHPGPYTSRSAIAWLLISTLVLANLIAGCTPYTKRRKEAIYDPAESVTEIVAVLRRHIPDDTYRYPPGKDFTGRNVYRASLIRLENIERMYSNELRSGYLDSVIAFAKARSLERLRAYDLASRHYRAAAKRDGEMRAEALRSAAICEAIQAAVQIGMDMTDPTGTVITPYDLDTHRVTSELDQRVGELLAIENGLDDDQVSEIHYHAILRQEVERADVIRARYFVGLRHISSEGSVRAVSELQRLLERHAASQNRRKHLLNLAALYEDFAREYVEAVPPESLRFDPPKFQELVEAAAQLYQSVASQDGTSEKLEAARRLEAFLAFTLRVDRDRYSQ